jgi:hypothetical protein
VATYRYGRCIVRSFDGAVFSPGWKEAPWARFFTTAPTTTEAVRRAIQHSRYTLVRLILSRLAISVPPSHLAASRLNGGKRGRGDCPPSLLRSAEAR